MEILFRRSRFFIPLFALCMLSCNGFGNKHIEMKKMEKIMMDITMAEAYSNLVAYDSASPYKPGMRNLDSLAVFHKEIFRHYKITAKQFKESMDWYENHPEEMDSIVTHIAKTLTAQGKKYGIEN